MNLTPYQTLVEPVIEHARRDPDHLTLVFMAEDGSERQIRAAQFHREALAYAQALRAIDVGPENLVILVLPHSLELPVAFWGALYLGAIPSIFPFLSEKLDPAIYMERVRTLVCHSQARAVITSPEFKVFFEALLGEVGCQILSINEVSSVLNTSWDNLNPANLNSDKIAFLQHSSGTTGLQKGVALSHRAVLNQLDAYGQVIDLSPEDVIVSWLPLYHDMGLIAGFIMPVVMGVPLVLMSPFHWVRDPKILLWAIHQYKGTLAWLPNFAYNHCVRSIRRRDLEGLDLSSWRAAINCSEPVRHDSHRLFLERFAPYGFRESALTTCYAMAENTFAVTQSPPGQPPRVDWVHLQNLQEKKQAVPISSDAPEATPFVSCGLPIPGADIAVVDEEGQSLPERHVGEIMVRSNSMLKEYYRRPDLTQQTVRNDWYHTGDMGYLAEGQLYISGRKKDLIIVGGKNIYPQDLEAIANEVPGIYPGRTVAFGVPDERLGSEGIVMVCELVETPDGVELKAIESQLRRRIVQDLDVTLTDVRLVNKRWLIKTSSGKISRSANRDRYLREFRQS
jgi:acyl-CoA synthetase (AMP-forming)/AMP-acid ligase II